MQTQITQTEIERLKKTVFRYKNDLKEIEKLKIKAFGVQKKQLPLKSWFYKNWHSSYLYDGKSSNIFGYIKNKHNEIVGIESATLSYSKENSNKEKQATIDNSDNAKPFHSIIPFNNKELKKEEIVEIGNYKIIKSDFEKGIFEWEFHPHESFKGTVGFSFEVNAKNITEFKLKIKDLNYKINDFNKELLNIFKELEKVNERLNKENEIIEEVKRSQDAKQYLLDRFLNLKYDVQMFIEYLYKKESINNTLVFSSIETKLNDIVNLRNDETIKMILKEMKLKTLDDLKLILKELNSKEKKTSLYDERDRLIKNLDNTINEFDEKKENIKKLEKYEIKIIKEIKGFVELNDSTKLNLDILSELKSSAEENNILSKTYSKTPFEKITLEIKLVQTSVENPNDENYDKISIIQNFNLSGTYTERLACVTRLIATDKNVFIF